VQGLQALLKPASLAPKGAEQRGALPAGDREPGQAGNLQLHQSAQLGKRPVLDPPELVSAQDAGGGGRGESALAQRSPARASSDPRAYPALPRPSQRHRATTVTWWPWVVGGLSQAPSHASPRLGRAPVRGVEDGQSWLKVLRKKHPEWGTQRCKRFQSSGSRAPRGGKRLKVLGDPVGAVTWGWCSMVEADTEQPGSDMAHGWAGWGEMGGLARTAHPTEPQSQLLPLLVKLSPAPVSPSPPVYAVRLARTDVSMALPQQPRETLLIQASGWAAGGRTARGGSPPTRTRGCAPRSLEGKNAGVQTLGIECRLPPETIPSQPRPSRGPEKPRIFWLPLTRPQWHRAMRCVPRAPGSPDGRAPGREPRIPVPVLLSCHQPVATGSPVLVGDVRAVHSSPALISWGSRGRLCLSGRYI